MADFLSCLFIPLKIRHHILSHLIIPSFITLPQISFCLGIEHYLQGSFPSRAHFIILRCVSHVWMPHKTSLGGFFDIFSNVYSSSDLTAPDQILVVLIIRLNASSYEVFLDFCWDTNESIFEIIDILVGRGRPLTCTFLFGVDAVERFWHSTEPGWQICCNHLDLFGLLVSFSDKSSVLFRLKVRADNLWHSFMHVKIQDHFKIQQKYQSMVVR